MCSLRLQQMHHCGTAIVPPPEPDRPFARPVARPTTAHSKNCTASRGCQPHASENRTASAALLFAGSGTGPLSPPCFSSIYCPRALCFAPWFAPDCHPPALSSVSYLISDYYPSAPCQATYHASAFKTAVYPYCSTLSPDYSFHKHICRLFCHTAPDYPSEKYILPHKTNTLIVEYNVLEFR